MKYKIAAINLGISQLISLSFLLFAYFAWFPHSLFQLNSFSKSAYLLVIVNLILGPFLILLFYKKDKINLKLDILALAVIQSSALIFGMYSIYQKHPIYAVFTIDRFTLINANSAEPKKIRHNDLEVTFLSKPKLAFAKMPTEIHLKNEIIMSQLKGGPDLDARAEYYEPYVDHINSVISKSLDIKGNLKQINDQLELSTFLKKHGGNADSYAYLPLQSNEKDVIWVLNRLTAKPIGILHIDPWQFSKTTVRDKKLKHTIRRWLS